MWITIAVTYPNLKRPINYIDLSNEEVVLSYFKIQKKFERWNKLQVRHGYWVYYCLAKVEEMKIQNVKGSPAIFSQVL